MVMAVYIPTLDRHENLKKVIPYWIEQGFQVRLVVERYDYSLTNALKNDMGWNKAVYVLPVQSTGRGIGYARRYCVLHAQRTKLESIVMSDDDLRPARDTDMSLLLKEAARPGVLGIGATRSLHDRNTGGFISSNHGPILCPGGWGFQVFGLNVRAALSCGNFDSALHSLGEDAEMARRGISKGMPWLVHCDVRSEPIGKRYDPGGISARFGKTEDRKAAERECMVIIHKRWPDYTNHPDKPLRTSWQKMLNDYMPSWREFSALHGGSLQELRDRQEEEPGHGYWEAGDY